MTISALDPYKSRYIPPPHTKEQRRNSNEDLNHSITDGKITARKKLIFINYYYTSKEVKVTLERAKDLFKPHPHSDEIPRKIVMMTHS
jgi:hypothetical protein